MTALHDAPPLTDDGMLAPLVREIGRIAAVAEGREREHLAEIRRLEQEVRQLRETVARRPRRCRHACGSWWPGRCARSRRPRADPYPAGCCRPQAPGTEIWPRRP
jgi:hypothetical protein